MSSTRPVNRPRGALILITIGVVVGLVLGGPVPGALNHFAPAPRMNTGLQYRLAPAPVVATRSDSYAYLLTQDDHRTPVTWNPCRSIHLVVRPDGAPPGGAELLAEALESISQATGLRFVVDGTTDEKPRKDRAAHRSRFEMGRHAGIAAGDDRFWAPVLVAWQSSSENAVFATDVVGQAEPVMARSRATGRWVYVSGQIELSSTRLAEVMRRPHGRDIARVVIAHELGHLVGLGHTTDALQVMYPTAATVITDLGAGDRTGLANLGRGVCVPDL